MDRPFLWIEPAREVTSLRTTASPKFQAKTTGDGGKVVPVSGATGSQIEARVSCTGVKAAGAAAVRRHTLSEAFHPAAADSGASLALAHQLPMSTDPSHGSAERRR